MESKPLARSGLSWLTSGPKMLIDGGHAIVRISLTVLVFVGCLTTNVDAMNLEACGKGLNGAQENAWNATNGTSAGPTLQLTYEQCVAQCGGGIGDINWGAFSQSFGAWFLPWIALMFQIPFGAEDPSEDVLNFFVTIGSPCLAAYSLQITHLNTRWLEKACSNLKFPNSKSISTVMAAFQHAPVQISSDPALLPSLIVLPKNDVYWESLLKGVEKTRRWSIPLVMNFVWVVVATLLTIIDSFHSPPAGDVGYSIVAIWTYLLPLIMGWLHVGSQPEPKHLSECLEAANRLAWVATNDKNSPALAEDIPGQSARAIEFTSGEVDRAWRDELRMVPVFNYSRVFIWSLNAQHVLSLVKNASDKVKQRTPVNNPGPGKHAGASWVVGGAETVANENRLGTEDQVIRYCTEVTPPSEKLFGAPSPVYPPSPVVVHFPGAPTVILPSFNSPAIWRPSRWAPGVWGRVVVATLFALGLQWGTVGAAVVIHYWKAPVGLGCRAMSFLMYGVAATFAFFLCLASSVLAHMSRPEQDPAHWPSWSQRCMYGGAVFCGYGGKALAVASGIGILVVCFFQSSKVFATCYCASFTFDRGMYDVYFLTINYVVGPSVIKVWIGGLVLAFSTAALFGFSIYLGTPRRR